MQLQNQVVKGTLPTYGAGSPAVLSGDQFGAGMVSDLNARYANLVLTGNTFIGCNTAATALTVQGASTYTGLALANPAGSGKNLVLMEITLAPDGATNGAAAVVLCYGPAVSLTASTSIGPLSALLSGGQTSVAKVGASATITQATPIRTLLGITATTAVTTSFIKDDVGGAVVIPPGMMVYLAISANALSVYASYTWAELPQ